MISWLTLECAAFQIDATDTQAGNIQPALSRPPSRASYRGTGGSNEPIDLTAEHAAADPSKSLTSDEQDEQYNRQMATALALSKGEMPPGQENGITGTGQRFGPAHPGFHDPNKWAMTLSNATALEVPENPPPELRRRKAEEPAFLRPSHRSGYLHSLLTIYHSIPLARAALLLPSVQNVSYGYDSEWWSGTRIVAPKVVSYDDGVVQQSDWDDFIYETQRLMAFMDGTTRSFGSADVLADLDCYRQCNSDSELSQFFQTWIGAALELAPDEQLTQIFSSVALKNPRNARAQISHKEFTCLEPHHRLGQETLYDTLDTAIWCDDLDLPLDDVWIEHIAPVFTMRLHDPEPNPALKRDKVDVKIPGTWYPDRYLEACKQLSRDMRARKIEVSRDIHRLRILQARCSTQAGPNGQLDVRETLLEAAKAAELAVKDKALPNGLHEDSGMLSSSTTPISNAEGERCAQELRRLVERIDKKMRSLEEQTERTLEIFRSVAQQLTQPSSDSKDPPMHKYTLRGVSTKPHITYVLRPVLEDLMDVSGDDKGDANGEWNGTGGDEAAWQWWRISFSNEESHLSEELPMHGPPTQAEVQATESSAIDGSGQISDWSRKVQQPESRSCFSVRKVREVEVLKAARAESNSVLLVYANEDAIKLDPSRIPDLTPELRAFVEADNAAFERELRGEIGAEMQDVSTADETGKLVDDEDMETMPPSSPKRSSDGTASPPKRFKTSDDRFTRLPTPPDEPPPYEAIGSNGSQEMQEKGSGSSPLTTVRSNRIGQHAERMMARIEESNEDESGRDSNGL